MKKFIRENKMVFALICIVIICTVVSVSLLLKYFYFGNGQSKYGDRLDGIENVEISDSEKTDLESKIKEDSSVESASVRVQGKIVYIRIKFSAGYDLTKAENLAVKTLENFSTEELAFYDISFTLVSDATDDNAGFTIMGSRNVNGTNLVWNNNNASTEDDEEE